MHSFEKKKKHKTTQKAIAFIVTKYVLISKNNYKFLSPESYEFYSHKVPN